MKNPHWKTWLFKLLVMLVCFPIMDLHAQVPSDLSMVKSSQISDEQLKVYVNRAKESGYAPEDLERELLARGLPESEMMALRIRIEQLGWMGDDTDAKDSVSVTGNTSTNTKRKYFRNGSMQQGSIYASGKTLLFGSELFSGSQLSFEPDLRMPTPKDYIIGPDDELRIQIYGQNVSQQSLKVSPEGVIHLRYAGVVQVGGLTVEAASAAIQSSLLKYYPSLKTGQTKLQVVLGNIRSIRVVLIGAVNRPGTYTLPSLATLYNALYVSGGPLENGSLRTIELIRNGKQVLTADLYDFLMRGDLSGNARLQDNDVIRIPFAKVLITLKGQLNRPGIFEIKEGETLAGALDFAGGFAGKAFRNRITGKRYDGFGRKVLDISSDSIQYFKPLHGDEYQVDSVINRYENRVIISGAVMKPGEYALEPQMTFQQLIEKAQGFKEDVYSGRAILVRNRKDLSKENLSFDLLPVIEGFETGPILKREDSIYISSIFELRDTTYVSINGAVRRPGNFKYDDSLTLKSLILMAGGYAENGTGKGIEISRRKQNVNVSKAGSAIVDIISFDDNKDLSLSSKDLTLQAFDIITIKEDPYYQPQISVKVSGEVLIPSVYTLKSREERISSLIQRSGGLLYTANIRGAKLVRVRKDMVDTADVKRLLMSFQRDTSNLRNKAIVGTIREVAIDLTYILAHPGSPDDIILEEGDELVIPRKNNTVSVHGEVYKPLDIMFERKKSMKDYLSDAGGVTQIGKRRKAFVIYPNGSSARIKKTLGVFPNYPTIEPGSSIFVPQKPKRSDFEPAKAGIMISALTAFITAVSLILR